MHKPKSSLSEPNFVITQSYNTTTQATPAFNKHSQSNISSTKNNTPINHYTNK